MSAFRVFRSNLREAFERYSGPYVSIDVLLTWSTQRFSAIPVAKSASIRRSVRLHNQEADYTCDEHAHWIQHLTFTDRQPSRIYFNGIWGCDFGVVTVRYLLYGGVVPGFSFLASIISIFSGAQLFALGIFGEYLARVHTRTMDKPPYACRQPRIEDG